MRAALHQGTLGDLNFYVTPMENNLLGCALEVCADLLTLPHASSEVNTAPRAERIVAVKTALGSKCSVLVLGCGSRSSQSPAPRMRGSKSLAALTCCHRAQRVLRQLHRAVKKKSAQMCRQNLLLSSLLLILPFKSSTVAQFRCAQAHSLPMGRGTYAKPRYTHALMIQLRL